MRSTVKRSPRVYWIGRPRRLLREERAHGQKRTKGETTTYVSTFKNPIALTIVVYLCKVIVIHTLCSVLE
jgi:hypothetical protein